MTFEELRQAAQVFDRINEIRSYVTKERFAAVAQTRFGIDDETRIDVMYGLLQITPRLVYYIAHYGEEGIHAPQGMKYMDKVVEIAESAYSLKPKVWDSWDDVPHIEHGRYNKMDMRRYFYTDGDERRTLDVSMSSRDDLILLSELLKREVKINGVAEQLGCLDGELKGRERERFKYFEGDIYLLYQNPSDSIFYDRSRSGDAGVYVATPDGWRKLLYTPTRGYVERNGELSFVDDKHFYSDYMLEASGRGFLYVGNIHNDMSVLVEKQEGE